MEIVTRLSLEEYLRFVCASRGVRVKKDSEFAGYTLTSIAGEIGYGFATKEEAFRDFCGDEPSVDLRFIEENLDVLTLREGDEIKTPDGKNGVVAEIFSKSGLIESPQTKMNIADGNDKVFRTICFADLNVKAVVSHSEFRENREEYVDNRPALDDSADIAGLTEAPKKQSPQFSFNF